MAGHHDPALAVLALFLLLLGAVPALAALWREPVARRGAPRWPGRSRTPRSRPGKDIPAGRAVVAWTQVGGGAALPPPYSAISASRSASQLVRSGATISPPPVTSGP